jgi:RNA polymerase sigma factor (sigma-70 family)
MRFEIEEAVQLLRRGDDAALEQALTLLQNTVFSFSMRVCGHREDAEDTMQEVLLKAVPYLPKFDSPKALVVWLYKVAKNHCLMSRRRSKFVPKPDLSLEELMPDRKELEQMGTDGSINPETFAIRSEEAGRLRDTIQQLPPQYRIVLVRARYGGADRRRGRRDHWPAFWNGAGSSPPRQTVCPEGIDESVEIKLREIRSFAGIFPRTTQRRSAHTCPLQSHVC